MAVVALSLRIPRQTFVRKETSISSRTIVDGVALQIIYRQLILSIAGRCVIAGKLAGDKPLNLAQQQQNQQDHYH
jgi:hypothetical protein